MVKARIPQPSPPPLSADATRVETTSHSLLQRDFPLGLYTLRAFLTLGVSDARGVRATKVSVDMRVQKPRQPIVGEPVWPPPNRSDGYSDPRQEATSCG